MEMLLNIVKAVVVMIGDVLEAVRHARCIKRQIVEATAMDETQRKAYAEELRVPYSLLNDTVTQGRLPVVNFAAGGIGREYGISTVSPLGFVLPSCGRKLPLYTLQRTGKTLDLLLTHSRTHTLGSTGKLGFDPDI